MSTGMRIMVGGIARLLLAAVLSLPFQVFGRDLASSIGAWIFIGLLVLWPFQKRLLRKVLPPVWQARFKLNPPPSLPVYPAYAYNPANFTAPPYPPLNNAPPGYNYGPPSGPNPYGHKYPPASGPHPYSYSTPTPPYGGGYPAAQSGPPNGYTPPASGPNQRYGQPHPGYGATPNAANSYGQPLSNNSWPPPPPAPVQQNQAGLPASTFRPTPALNPAQAANRPIVGPLPIQRPQAADPRPNLETSSVIAMPLANNIWHRKIRQKQIELQLGHLQIGVAVLSCLAEIARLKNYLEKWNSLEWNSDLLNQYEAWAKNTGSKLEQAAEAMIELIQAENLTNDTAIQDYIVEANLTPGNQRGRLLDELPPAFEQLAATLVRANAILQSSPNGTSLTTLRETLNELELQNSGLKVQD